MKSKKIDRLWLVVSCISFFLLSVSFLLMPLEGGAVSPVGISYYAFAAGILFWVSLAAGVMSQLVLAHRRRAWFSANSGGKARSTQRIGLISFFKNAGAIVADVVMAVSLVGLIASVLLSYGTSYLCYGFLSVFVFSFSMHCILNGRIYYHVIHQN